MPLANARSATPYSARMFRALLPSLLLLGLVPTAHADSQPPPPSDGDYVRVILEQPSASPFSVVRYEIVTRGRTTSAIHRRQLPGYGEPLHGLSLLTRKEAGALYDRLRALGALELTEAAPAAGARAPDVSWRVQVSLDGKEREWLVHDPIDHKDRRHFRIIEAVRQVVVAHAGAQPYRNVFYDADDMGWVNILSAPVAKIRIDGFDTQLETPLYGYELAEGTHSVRLVTPDGAYDRTYKIKVEAGVTTHLAVDLR